MQLSCKSGRYARNTSMNNKATITATGTGAEIDKSIADIKRISRRLARAHGSIIAFHGDLAQASLVREARNSLSDAVKALEAL